MKKVIMVGLMRALSRKRDFTHGCPTENRKFSDYRRAYRMGYLGEYQAHPGRAL